MTRRVRRHPDRPRRRLLPGGDGHGQPLRRDLRLRARGAGAVQAGGDDRGRAVVASSPQGCARRPPSATAGRPATRTSTSTGSTSAAATRSGSRSAGRRPIPTRPTRTPHGLHQRPLQLAGPPGAADPGVHGSRSSGSSCRSPRSRSSVSSGPPNIDALHIRLADAVHTARPSATSSPSPWPRSTTSRDARRLRRPRLEAIIKHLIEGIFDREFTDRKRRPQHKILDTHAYSPRRCLSANSTELFFDTSKTGYLDFVYDVRKAAKADGFLPGYISLRFTGRSNGVARRRSSGTTPWRSRSPYRAARRSARLPRFM